MLSLKNTTLTICMCRKVHYDACLFNMLLKLHKIHNSIYQKVILTL